MRGGGNMMKQAMALQANMKKAQDEIAAMEIVGESGGGMVKVTMNGKHEVKRVQIERHVGREPAARFQASLLGDKSARCSTPHRSPGSSTRCVRCRESARRPRRA